jgi:hypothetical protein
MDAMKVPPLITHIFLSIKHLKKGATASAAL